MIVGPAGVARSIRLLQFGDSALPVGSFSFSNGLEPAVHRGVVVDVRTLREFVGTATHQSASSDGIALLHAHRAAGRGDLAGIATARPTEQGLQVQALAQNGRSSFLT